MLILSLSRLLVQPSDRRARAKARTCDPHLVEAQYTYANAAREGIHSECTTLVYAASLTWEADSQICRHV